MRPDLAEVKDVHVPLICIGGADEHAEPPVSNRRQCLSVRRGKDRLSQVDLSKQTIVLKVGQQQGEHAPPGSEMGWIVWSESSPPGNGTWTASGKEPRRETPLNRVIVVTGKCYLLQVVLTGHAGRGFTDLLYSRKEKANEDCDDRDDNEQFDQIEPAARGSVQKNCMPSFE